MEVGSFPRRGRKTAGPQQKARLKALLGISEYL
jgi:hypothetical protein